MSVTENQAVTSNRDKLLSIASERYPDKRFAGQFGEDGVEGQDDLEQAILDLINEQQASIEDNNSKNEQILRVMSSDPQLQSFVTKWVESGDPRGALVEEFGDELSELATEEGRGRFNEQLSGWRQRKDDTDKMNSEAEANWDSSLEALDAFGNQHGLDDSQKAQLMLRLVNITAKGLMNKYDTEDFEMVLKETNFDKAVASARREGEIAGRNAKIKAEMRTRNAASNNMPPTMPGGQGMRAAADKPNTKYNPWDEVE